MKVTVCEFPDDPAALEVAWLELVDHVHSRSSDFVLLPEMPFSPWIGRGRPFVQDRWEQAVNIHEAWLDRLRELAPAGVAGTRPVNAGGRRQNEGFFLSPETGYQKLHTKYYLPDEDLFWEASWYERGEPEFGVLAWKGVRLAMLICTELWFLERARAYGREGAHLLLCPRATPGATADKWVAGGRAAAVVSGAYCLSANRGGTDSHGLTWGGNGWITDPEEGDVLALTSEKSPFVTLEITPGRADAAKKTYPRYVPE